MYKFLAYSFLGIGFLTWIATYALVEKDFTGYFFGSGFTFGIIRFSASDIRIFICIYYLVLVIISYLLSSLFCTSKANAIKYLVALTFPLTFYLITNQNTNISAGIWGTVLPFYNYPQSYVALLDHYAVTIAVLFLINIIALLLFLFKPILKN